MVRLGAWTTRTFTFDLPISAFPAVLERLRGMPARADELVAGVDEAWLGERLGGKWSIKDNLGHLTDLHALDMRRIREFLDGVAMLSSADPKNEATEAGQHSRTPIGVVLDRLRVTRTDVVRQLEALREDDIARTAMHPRLRQRLRLVDWMQFVAEHDDHHLARARQILVALGRGAESITCTTTPRIADASSTT